MTAIDRREKLKAANDNAYAALRDAMHAHRDIARKHFEDNDGCTECLGRGWVVTWDTLDSVTGCYHESGPCPNEACTPATRAASGLAPCSSKYYSFHAGSTWNPTDEQLDVERKLQDVASAAKFAYNNEERRWDIAVGRLVKVTGSRSRGRNRQPLGMIGVVKSLPRTRWGDKVVFLNAQGTECWTNGYDLTVIDPEPDLEALGFETKVGFPCLAAFLKLSRSGKALLVLNPLDGTERWIPASQINQISVRRGGQTSTITKDKLRSGDTVTLFVARWVAEEKGFATK